jgi:ABC-2 type transport system permease protein
MYLIPFFFLLLLTGWTVGLFVTGLILRYGTRIQTLAWAMVAVISPFSAVYYPVSSLPVWAQNIAAAIPSSYVFEGMRQALRGHTINLQTFSISFLLNVFYFILACFYVKKSFDKLMQKGFLNIT